MITRELTGLWKTQDTVVRDRVGKAITKEEVQLARWSEQFQSVLSKPDPETSAVVQSGAWELLMNEERPHYMCRD